MKKSLNLKPYFMKKPSPLIFISNNTILFSDPDQENKLNSYFSQWKSKELF